MSEEKTTSPKKSQVSAEIDKDAAEASVDYFALEKMSPKAETLL
jgi:hypothetical protein